MAGKVAFLGMGGTIAGRSEVAGDNVGYKAGALPLEEVLASVPGLKGALGGRSLVAEQVAQIDSKDMETALWLSLARRIDALLKQPDIDGIVVTHGTDTIEETAYFLSRVLPPEGLTRKPVVMTCAMRPASAQFADGPANLLDAAVVASTSGASGVTVVCGGMIHAGRLVQKVHTYRLDPFESVDTAPVGVIEEGRVRLVAGWGAANDAQAHPVRLPELFGSGIPRVEIVVSHGGASGHMVRAMLKPVESVPRLRGLVVAGTGNGSIHKDLDVALHEAASQGVSVVRVSRCMHGQIVESRSGSDMKFRHLPLSAVKARIELLLELAGT